MSHGAFRVKFGGDTEFQLGMINIIIFWGIFGSSPYVPQNVELKKKSSWWGIGKNNFFVIFLK